VLKELDRKSLTCSPSRTIPKSAHKLPGKIEARRSSNCRMNLIFSPNVNIDQHSAKVRDNLLSEIQDITSCDLSFSGGLKFRRLCQPRFLRYKTTNIGGCTMALSYEERRRLEAEDEAWERADPLPPRSRTPADVFERIRHTVERIGTGIRYVFRAVESVVLGGLFVFFGLFFVLPYILIARCASCALRNPRIWTNHSTPN
jgi:hypothetical protein